MSKMIIKVHETKQAKKIYPKFVQINTQRDFDKYIKPALGRGADAYGLSDIEGMWWEIADGERVPASAKTMREIRDSISKRPRFIFISGVGAERGIADLSLTEYAEEMGMTVKEYLNGYDAGSWESKKSESWDSYAFPDGIHLRSYSGIGADEVCAEVWKDGKQVDKVTYIYGYDGDKAAWVKEEFQKLKDRYPGLTVYDSGDLSYSRFADKWYYEFYKKDGTCLDPVFAAACDKHFDYTPEIIDKLAEGSKGAVYPKKKSEDSLDDFDNRRRVSPSSKYITFSGLARGAVRDDVRRVLSKSGILDPQLGKPDDSVRFEFGVQNNPRSVRKALAALLELGKRNTWYIKYSDGDSEHNRITMFSPDIPNDMWYTGDVDKIVSYIMPAKSEAANETLSYEKGNKNSRGEDAPWVIRDHKGGKILASFAKKKDAEDHLERMQRYSKSESLKKNFRFKDPTTEDDLEAIQEIVCEIYRQDEGSGTAETIQREMDSLMSDAASRISDWSSVGEERRTRLLYRAIRPVISRITSERLDDIFFSPGADHEYFRDVIEYDEEVEAPEYRADDLYDFSLIRHESLKKALHESRARKLERMGNPKREAMGEIVFEPVVNFKPQQYAVYEIDNDGDELECIFSGTPGGARKKLGDAIDADPNKKFHVVAIAYTPRGQLADSEVVWSDVKRELAP